MKHLRQLRKCLSLLIPFLTAEFGLWLIADHKNIAKLRSIFTLSQQSTNHLCNLSTTSLIPTTMNNNKTKNMAWEHHIWLICKKKLDTVNDLCVYCSICIKILKHNMHLLFPDGMSMLSPLIIYNIRQKIARNRWWEIIHAENNNNGISCKKTTTSQKKVQFLFHLLSNYHQRNDRLQWNPFESTQGGYINKIAIIS